MSQINFNIFLEEKAKKNILEQISRYCSQCYKEFKENETIYYDMQNYSYLCKECADSKSLLLQDSIFEDEIDNKYNTQSLF